MEARFNVRAALVAAAGVVALFGVGVSPWAAADAPAAPVAVAEVAAIATEPKPPARRREAVVRMPVGTFVKQFDAAPYASGRLTWSYEEDRVAGAIEVESAAIGGHLELATDAEIAMSSNGTIFGVLNAVRVNRLQVNPAMIGGEFPVKIGADMYPLVEPIVNDVMVDLPFSYQCRQSGDRLTISHFRMLLAGPNPLGKLGVLGFDGNEVGAVLAYFQAISAAVEGTYTLADAKEPPARRELPRLGPKLSAAPRR